MKKMKILSIMSAGVNLTRLILSLIGLWVELGWSLRRTRKAFEKELIKQGMKKQDARRISAQFTKLKNEITSSLTRFPRVRRLS
jgi:hypothetical protein